MDKQIGLIGIGLAGSALAENLLRAGYRVVGYDIDPLRSRWLAGAGGVSGDSPRAASSGGQWVVLSLLDSSVVREVLFGADGVLSRGQGDPVIQPGQPAPPRYVIDTTTGDPDATDQIARDCAARGTQYLDATISGSSDQIRRRQGLFMVGSSPEAFHACGPVLAALAEKVFHVGPAGAGARTKLAVNLILGLNRLALAEGLLLAERMGLEPESFLALLKESAAYSRVMDAKGPKMLAGDFAPHARLAQHAKDVALVLQQADRLGLSLPLSAAHYEVLKAAIAAGDGELDNSAVIRELRRRKN